MINRLICFLLLLFVFFQIQQSHAEDGLALTDSEKLSTLESHGFALSNLILQTPQVEPLNNSKLTQLPKIKFVFENLTNELLQLAPEKKEIAFDLDYLTSPYARFVLVGIINRMDRGYKSQNRCGELRFIYRLAYDIQIHGKTIRSRLPMTINTIFRGGISSDSNHCQQLAATWKKMNNLTTVSDWKNNGPLSSTFFNYQNIESIEFNVQASREGSENKENFGGNAKYLMKVYDWVNDKFEEGTLENQIDRQKIVSNPLLLKELKSWILQPLNLKALDQGTLVVPKKFLAKRAITIAPGGLARSANRPYYELFKSEDLNNISYLTFEQIKSQNGLIRRLNDTTCTGCHQSRAIGGFHFTGLDPVDKYPGNSVFLAGSPHFLGDLPRRKSIQNDLIKGIPTIDYSRGFATRPQLRRSQELLGSGNLNGWGAHCSTGKDPSFKSWSCAEGFVCKQLLDTQDDSGMGICIHSQQKIGDPCEFGTVKNLSFGVDHFQRTNNREIIDLDKKQTKCSPQSQDKGTLTGGFLNGNLRTLSCGTGHSVDDGLPPEASCGPLPAARPGFNACVGKKNFDECLKEFSIGVGLRGCDQKNPCRDDYICAVGFNKNRGICAPPYFLFQMRVDGHPKKIRK